MNIGAVLGVFAILIAEISEVSAESANVPLNPEAIDQMVCHTGKILTVLNMHYSKKSITCIRRSTKSTHEYNNLADVYAEGWFVVDINNDNTWVLNR